MQRLIVTAAVFAALAAPATASAKPSKADSRSAQTECRAERGSTPESRADFAEKYGTGRHKRNAFGKCVSRTAKALKEARERDELEASEEERAAAEQCDAERGETAESRAAFAEKYGTNRNRRNAFGKCVSQLERA